MVNLGSNAGAAAMPVASANLTVQVNGGTLNVRTDQDLRALIVDENAARRRSTS